MFLRIISLIETTFFLERFPLCCGNLQYAVMLTYSGTILGFLNCWMNLISLKNISSQDHPQGFVFDGLSKFTNISIDTNAGLHVMSILSCIFFMFSCYSVCLFFFLSAFIDVEEFHCVLQSVMGPSSVFLHVCQPVLGFSSPVLADHS